MRSVDSGEPAFVELPGFSLMKLAVIQVEIGV